MAKKLNKQETEVQFWNIIALQKETLDKISPLWYEVLFLWGCNQKTASKKNFIDSMTIQFKDNQDIMVSYILNLVHEKVSELTAEIIVKNQIPISLEND